MAIPFVDTAHGYQPDTNGNVKYHKDVAEKFSPPDISHIPESIKIQWDTPLNYVISFWELVDPHHENFWHPALSVDEQLRLMEYKANKYRESGEGLVGDIVDLEEDE